MKHETPTISAELRDRRGSRYAQRLRNAGRLPAVLYGHQEEVVSISVDEREMLTLLHHGGHLINLEIGGKKSETVLVKELQFGYLGDNVIHIDFSRVSLDEEVSVSVHLAFVGESEASRRPGAILQHTLTELEVTCRANNIPEEIKVDLSEIEDTLTVGEIELPAGVTTETDPGTLVAQISYVHDEEVGEEDEVVGEDQPEVITEAKVEAEADSE